MGIFKQALTALFTGLLCLFLLSACSFSGSGSENLRYPILADKENAVYGFLSNHIDGDYSLIYASRGNYQNPVLFTDLDGDGSDEVLVNFVSVPGTEKSVTTLILSDAGGKYTLLGNIQGYSDKLDKIEFADMDGDGLTEIIIGYGSLTDHYPSRLSIIYFNGVSYSQGYVSEYNDFFCTDLNCDGAEEVLNMSYTGLGASSATAFCIVYDKDFQGYRTLTGGAYLSSSDEFYRVIEDFTADGVPAVYVTSKYGTMLKGTEIIVWNELAGVPKNLSLLVSEMNKNFIYYGSAVAQDIDGDGVVEYPVSEVIDESVISADIRDAVNAQSMEILQYACSWYYIDNGVPVYDFSCYMNTDLDYYVTIKNPSRYTNVKVYKDSSGNFLFYYAKDSGSKELLFSVVASASAPADKSTELLYISETDTYLSYIVNPSLSASLREKLIPASELKESITVRGIITAG